MSPRLRTWLFVLFVLCVLPAFVHVALKMPTFGAHPLPYGAAINAAGPLERNVTNMVSAVNFDYRAIDTLGEEFILLCAVTGVAILLRSRRGEEETAAPGRVEDRPILPPSDAVVLVARLFGVLTLVLGLAVAAHAMVSPGGGFQGGVIVGSGLILIYLGERYRGWRKMIRSEVLDAVEATGAAVYALCGFASMAAGLPFLQNFVPLGKLGSVTSGGLMIPINAGVLLAVTAGFGVLFMEFMEETRVEPKEEEGQE